MQFKDDLGLRLEDRFVQKLASCREVILEHNLNRSAYNIKVWLARSRWCVYLNTLS